MIFSHCRDVPRAGSAVTLMQFIAAAIFAFINVALSGGPIPPFQTGVSPQIPNGNWWRWIFKPAIPYIHYISMIILFFIVQVVNNLAFKFNISMPLHMIFRSVCFIRLKFVKKILIELYVLLNINYNFITLCSRVHFKFANNQSPSNFTFI